MQLVSLSKTLAWQEFWEGGWGRRCMGALMRWRGHSWAAYSGRGSGRLYNLVELAEAHDGMVAPGTPYSQSLPPPPPSLPPPSSPSHPPPAHPQVDLTRLLLCEGLDLASLQDAGQHPITLEALEKKRQVRYCREVLSRGTAGKAQGTVALRCSAWLSELSGLSAGPGECPSASMTLPALMASAWRPLGACSALPDSRACVHG